jgi:hypothetical protein
MQAQAGGRIVLTSSAAIFGSPASLAYGAAKASLLGLGRSLAASGSAQNIMTNVLVPTAATRLTERFEPDAFMAWFNENFRAEQVAPVAAYLCHESCQLNGEILSVTGGRIGRVRLMETWGDVGDSASVEEVQRRLPTVLAQTEHFFPDSPSSRSLAIAERMGFVSGTKTDGFTNPGT